MLKYQNWYILTWTSVIALYYLRLSSFNQPLEDNLILFFIGTILIAALCSFLKRPVPAQRVIWQKEPRPIITVAICLAFCLDWMYQGHIPITEGYVGFDSSTSESSVGIPGVHIILISYAVFYAMYKVYLILSSFKFQYLLELAVLCALFVLNSSRGLIVQIAIVTVLLFISLHSEMLRSGTVKTYMAVLAGIIILIIFISIMGNVRYGFSWDDCSYIESIGRYDNYPEWLTKHFMWSYSYITTPLANLNYNIELGNSANNLLYVLGSCIPESISNLFVPHGSTLYIREYFNACTGYIGAATSAGIAGMALQFIFLFFYYSTIQKIVDSHGVLSTLCGAVLSSQIIVFLFYNSLSTISVSLLPIYLLCASWMLQKKRQSGELSIERKTER